MLVSWATVLVNMVANYVLVFGKFGFPDGAGRGAGGTVISQTVQLTLYLFFVLKLYGAELGLLKDFRFQT